MGRDAMKNWYSWQPGVVVKLALLGLALLGMAACAYSDRVAPVPLPERSSNMVVVGDGLKIAARAFVSPEEAKDFFGFDIRQAGVLPVQVTLQNDGSQAVELRPEQTFLIDRRQNAWPVNSLERTYQRTKSYIEVGETMAGAAKPSLLLGAAGAVVGLAVGIVSGENIGKSMGQGAVVGGAAGALLGGGQAYAEAGQKIKDDLKEKSLKNKAIVPGQLAYGIVFFPGLAGEAEGAVELRLGVAIGRVPEVVTLRFTP